jgi:hypothetical protein
LGIVVLEADLEFDGLGELALLHLLSDFSDCLGNLRVVDPKLSRTDRMCVLFKQTGSQWIKIGITEVMKIIMIIIKIG